MTPAERIQRVKDYVQQRLVEEVRKGPRGTQARLSEALKITTAHVANLTTGNPPRSQPGEEVCRKAAEYWKISFADLERMATGEEESVQPSVERPSTAPRNLVAALRAYHWRPEMTQTLRDMVRDQAAAHHRAGGVDFEPHVWERTISGLERDALGLHSRRVPPPAPPPVDLDRPSPERLAQIAARKGKKPPAGKR